MTLERRNIVRDKVHLAAFASIEGGPESTVVDLSEAGIGLQAASSAVHPESAVQSDVRVTLELPATQTSIETRGVIAWSQGSGRAGVRFSSLAEGPQRLVRQFLAMNAAYQQPVAEAVPNQNALTADADISDLKLQVVVDRARCLTSASGAAVAILEDAGMVCRAISGDLVPPPGTRLGLGSGITAECVRKRAVLRCDDAENDPGVDRDSCRALGIRSIVVVPVNHGTKVVGVLEIVSAAQHAFATYDQPGLQRIIDQILTGRVAQSPDSEVTKPPAATPPAPVVAPVTEELSQPEVTDADEQGTIQSRAMELLSRLREPDSWVIRNRILLGATAGTILGAVVLSFSPGLQRRPQVAAQATEPATVAQVPYSQPGPATGFRKQPSRAVSELEKLARNGDADAQFSLGARYATGDQVAQDYTQAVKWFMRSAEQGHVVAQAALGACYWAGRGVTQDYVQSYMWSSLAKLGGDEASKYRVGVLRPRMSNAQVAEAQRLMQSWLRQHPERAARFSPSAQIQP